MALYKEGDIVVVMGFTALSLLEYNGYRAKIKYLEPLKSRGGSQIYALEYKPKENIILRVQEFYLRLAPRKQEASTWESFKEENLCDPSKLNPGLTDLVGAHIHRVKGVPKV